MLLMCTCVCELMFMLRADVMWFDIAGSIEYAAQSFGFRGDVVGGLGRVVHAVNLTIEKTVQYAWHA